MKKSKFLYFLPALFMMFGMAFLQSCSDDDDDDVVESAVPEKYTSALKEAYPDVKSPNWEIKGSYYVAEFTKNMVDYDVWFDSSAAISMTEQDYGKDLFLVMDNSVSAAFAQGEYGTWTIDDISHYTRTSDEFYVFEVEKAGQPDMNLYYNTDGELVNAIQSSQAPDITPTTTLAAI